MFGCRTLPHLDIAAMNILCAVGLRGADAIDPEHCLGWLETAAAKVDFETRRHWYRFLRSPGDFENSPGFFCCSFLLQILQEDFRVRYNPARVRDPKFQDPKCFDPDFRDSQDLFIHGIIDGPGGTCSSMPVLYVAVGRRLGYPLKLVETRGHLFVRWDDPRGTKFGIPEVFNIEGAGEGIALHDDEHYRHWPEEWTEADAAGGWYLRSLDARGEFAAFLAIRGECLTDNHRVGEAIQAYNWACRLKPEDARYRAQLTRLTRRQSDLGIAEMEERMALARARQERIDRLLPQPSRRQPPGHGAECRCWNCDQERLKQSAPVFPHGPSCRCAACDAAREKAKLPQGMPGHSDFCLCAMCLQRRSMPR